MFYVEKDSFISWWNVYQLLRAYWEYFWIGHLVKKSPKMEQMVALPQGRVIPTWQCPNTINSVSKCLCIIYPQILNINTHIKLFLKQRFTHQTCQRYYFSGQPFQCSTIKFTTMGSYWLKNWLEYDCRVVYYNCRVFIRLAPENLPLIHQQDKGLINIRRNWVHHWYCKVQDRSVLGHCSWQRPDSFPTFLQNVFFFKNQFGGTTQLDLESFFQG